MPTATETIISLIMQERDRLNAALIALGVPGERKRGRPPKNAAKPETPAPAPQAPPPPPQPVAPVGRNWKPASRKRQAAAMRARWEQARAAGRNTLVAKAKPGRKPKTMTAGGAG